MLGNPDKEWEKFGKNDPYYGVIVLKKFHKDVIDEESLRDFFQSGEDHIAYTMETIRSCFGAEYSPSRALDFGCGVGRCVIPLAQMCLQVVGIDTSASMLAEARRNCGSRGLENVDLVRASDSLSHLEGSFDLIHSSFTFQCIPRRRGMKLFQQLLDRLSDHGVGVMDFLVHRKHPVAARVMGFLRRYVPLFNNFANLAFGKPFGEPLMLKDVYDLNEIVTILHRNGCGDVQVKVFQNGNQRDALLFFQKTQAKALPHQSWFNKVASFLAFLPAIGEDTVAALSQVLPVIGA